MSDEKWIIYNNAEGKRSLYNKKELLINAEKVSFHPRKGCVYGMIGKEYFTMRSFKRAKLLSWISPAPI